MEKNEKKENLDYLYDTAKSAYENTYAGRNTLLSRANLALTAMIGLLSIFFATLDYSIFAKWGENSLVATFMTIYCIILCSALFVAILGVVKFVSLNRSIKLHSIYAKNFLLKNLQTNGENNLTNEIVYTYINHQYENTKIINEANVTLDKAYKYLSITIILLFASCIVRFILGVL